MTTTPAMPELPDLQDFGPWHVSHDGRFIDSDNFNHDVKLVVQGDFRNDEQRRSYALDIAKRLSRPALATLQAQPAAEVSDAVVKAIVGQAIGAQSTDEFEANVRAILALRPQAVPMTELHPLMIFARECELGVFMEHEVPLAARKAINAAKALGITAPAGGEVDRG